MSVTAITICNTTLAIIIHHTRYCATGHQHLYRMTPIPYVVI